MYSARMSAITGIILVLAPSLAGQFYISFSRFPRLHLPFSFLLFSTFFLYAALLYSTCAMWWRSYHVGSCGFDTVVSFSDHRYSGEFFFFFFPLPISFSPVLVGVDEDE